MQSLGCLQKPQAWVVQVDVELASIVLDEVCRPRQLLELTWVTALICCTDSLLYRMGSWVLVAAAPQVPAHLTYN